MNIKDKYVAKSILDAHWEIKKIDELINEIAQHTTTIEAKHIVESLKAALSWKLTEAHIHALEKNGESADYLSFVNLTLTFFITTAAIHTLIVTQSLCYPPRRSLWLPSLVLFIVIFKLRRIFTHWLKPF